LSFFPASPESVLLESQFSSGNAEGKSFGIQEEAKNGTMGSRTFVLAEGHCTGATAPSALITLVTIL
jgi:hypothetical protein